MSRIDADGYGLGPARAERWWLAAVLAAHAVLLTLLLSRPESAATPARPPAVLGTLVPPVEAVAPPRPAAPARPRHAPAAPRTRKAAAVQAPAPAAAPAAAPVAPPAPLAIAAQEAPAIAAAPTQAQAVPAVRAMPAEQAASAPEPATGAAKPAPTAGPPAVTPPRTDAAHLDNPAPAYPAISRRLGEQGRVLLEVYILEDGRVGEIRVKRSSGHARLDDAALDAVRRWHYVPARRGAQAIPWWYVQPVSFALNG